MLLVYRTQTTIRTMNPKAKSTRSRSKSPAVKTGWAIRARAPIERARPKIRSDKDSIRRFGGRMGNRGRGERRGLIVSPGRSSPARRRREPLNSHLFFERSNGREEVPRRRPQDQRQVEGEGVVQPPRAGDV